MNVKLSEDELNLVNGGAMSFPNSGAGANEFSEKGYILLKDRTPFLDSLSDVVSIGTKYLDAGKNCKFITGEEYIEFPGPDGKSYYHVYSGDLGKSGYILETST
jgi:hypothetical protein